MQLGTNLRHPLKSDTLGGSIDMARRSGLRRALFYVASGCVPAEPWKWLHFGISLS